MPRHLKYRSKRGSPACVKIWDKAFLHSSYWFYWLLAQGEVYSHIPEIQAQTGTSVKEATAVAWNAFCASIVGPNEGPFLSVYEDLMAEVPAQEMPLFVYWITLGVDVNNGLTQEEAKTAFLDWLTADEKNGLFEGGYRLLPSLTVVQERSG